MKSFERVNISKHYKKREIKHFGARRIGPHKELGTRNQGHLRLACLASSEHGWHWMRVRTGIQRGLHHTGSVLLPLGVFTSGNRCMSRTGVIADTLGNHVSTSNKK